MLINYLKITLAVLQRRKFFTFVSLFGICFTILVLIVLAAFLDHMFGANYPEVNRGRSLHVMSLQQRNPENGYSKMGGMSFHFAEKYLKTLQSVEQIGIVTKATPLSLYKGGKRFKFNLKYTDANFWGVTEFDFIEGRPYTEQDINHSENVVVISEQMRDQYFGKAVSAVGEEISIHNKTVKVVGVVKDSPDIMVMTLSLIHI